MTIPVVRKRAKRPKTRTGCRTCRARHIKCDEERPSCRRCVVSNRTCAGYELAVSSMHMRPKNKSILLPFDPRCNGSRPLDWSLSLTPVSLVGREAQAFDFFRTHTLAQLPDGPWSSFWGRIALQIACQEPVIVHAMVAVGAIHQYLDQAVEDRNTLCIDIRSDQHRFAVHHYSQAMAYMRDCVELMTRGNSNGSVEMVLVACLLFLSFESIQGSDTGAITHLRLGLRIIYERMGLRSASQSTPERRVVPLKAFPETTLERLLHTFVRLDYDSTMFGEREPYLLPECSVTLPASFTSLEEARTHLDVLSSAFLHAKGVTLKIAEHAIDHHPVYSSRDENARYSLMHAMSQTVSLDSDLNALSMLREAQDGLNKWLAAMSSFPVPLHKEALRTHLMLQIDFFHIWFWASTSRDDRELLCDRFRGSFAHIVDLSEQYLELTGDLFSEVYGANQSQSGRKHAFSLGMGLLSCLHTIAVKCRNSLVRRRAEVLIARTNVVGLEDSNILAIFTRRLIELEEKRARQIREFPVEHDLDYHDIPEQARVIDVTLSSAGDLPNMCRLVCTVWADSSCSSYETVDEVFSIS